MTPVITASVERRLDGKEDHEAQQSPSTTGPMVEDPRIRSPAAAYFGSGSTTEKAAWPGRQAEDQTRTVNKRPETLEESATQTPRARGPEGRTVLSIPNATPVLGLGRGDDSTVVFPSPIDRPFDVLDSRKPKTGRACTDSPSGHHGAEERSEAASAQAVKRGQVTVKEIPDDDDETSFRMSQRSNQKPLVVHEETQSTVTEPLGSGAKTEKVPHEWLKPFGAEWTLRGIKEAKTESEARAILTNWIHKTRVEEVVDEMLEGLRKAMRTNALEQMDELQKPRRYICRLSGNDKALTTDILIEMLSSRARINSSALIDSGCTSSAIDRAFVEKHHIPTRATAAPITVYNADGSRNSSGQITAFAELCITIGDHAECIDLAITDLKDSNVFLGHDWLVRHNPLINWRTGKMIFGRCQCRHTPIPLPDADPYDKWDEELEEGDTILAISFEEAIRIRASRHVANDLAAEANAGKETKTFEEMVPEWCRDFKDLFDKESFDELPEPKPWDHAIELTPNANANLDCKVYPLNRAEQEELDNFLDENLSSGRIRPSKSPMASPFFFVKKKDGKLRPVQDYRKLNEMMIKNRYPLPLISELMDKLRGAKYFSKLDVRWGYNNVWIKTGDEWKAAFRTNRGLYEPTVMFFGLTNSPATFQWMMNDIFKDLIASGKVTIYLDDILIMSKTKEEHRQITRRVLAILRKHKLFLKAEKCEFEVLETSTWASSSVKAVSVWIRSRPKASSTGQYRRRRRNSNPSWDLPISIDDL